MPNIRRNEALTLVSASLRLYIIQLEPEGKSRLECPVTGLGVETAEFGGVIYRETRIVD